MSIKPGSGGIKSWGWEIRRPWARRAGSAMTTAGNDTGIDIRPDRSQPPASKSSKLTTNGACHIVHQPACLQRWRQRQPPRSVLSNHQGCCLLNRLRVDKPLVNNILRYFGVHRSRTPRRPSSNHQFSQSTTILPIFRAQQSPIGKFSGLRKLQRFRLGAGVWMARNPRNVVSR